MKLLATILTAAMLFFGAQSVFALSGSVDAGTFPNEAGAIAAAKNVLSDINRGSNQEVKNHMTTCYNSSDAHADGFKIESVWKEGNSGIEKMYKASVSYQLQCDSVGL